MGNCTSHFTSQLQHQAHAMAAAFAQHGAAVCVMYLFFIFLSLS